MHPTVSLPFGLNHVAASSQPLASAIVGMILYGSWARGEATEASDIDVLMVMEPTVPIRRALYTAVDAIQGIDPRISLFLAHLPAEDVQPGDLWLDISLDGVILADTHGRIANTMDRIRQWIASGKVIRHDIHGQGYWVHI